MVAMVAPVDVVVVVRAVSEMVKAIFHGIKEINPNVIIVVI